LGSLESLSQSVDWLRLTLLMHWLDWVYLFTWGWKWIEFLNCSILFWQIPEWSNPKAHIILVTKNFVIVLNILPSKPVNMDMM
jgi:hypothetical protein